MTKRDLDVRVRDIAVSFGDPIPQPEIIYEGFAFDDDVGTLDHLPSVELPVGNLPGEYPIVLYGGEDHRYNYRFTNGRLKVLKPEQFEVFPNPVQRLLMIVPPDKASNYNISLFDNMGYLVILKSFSDSAIIDVTLLSAGIYHLQLRYTGGMEYLRLVVGP